MPFIGFFLLILFEFIVLVIILACLLWRWRRLRQLNIKANHIICKNDSFFWSLNPRSFRLNFNRCHIYLFEKPFIEFGSNIRFFYSRQTKEKPRLNGGRKRNQEFRKYWAESIIKRKRTQFSMLSFILLTLSLKLNSQLLLQMVNKKQKLILCISFLTTLLASRF